MKDVSVGKLTLSNSAPFALIAGPCQLESLDHARMLASRIADAADAAGVPWIFKASYDKANRSSLGGKRGLGMEAGLEILGTIKAEFDVPVLTDVHAPEHCAPVAEVVDILQIPAFLSRQTDLLLAAGETGAAINVKKGQFLAPWDMGNVADKIASTGNERIMLCERGRVSATTCWSRTCGHCRSWARPATRSCSMRRIRFSFRAGKAPPRADSANSWSLWRARPSPSAARRSSSKRMKTLTMPRATGRTWSRSTSCNRFWRASPRSTG